MKIFLGRLSEEARQWADNSAVGLGFFQVWGALRDIINISMYGHDAPRFAERIFVNPKVCYYSIRLGSQTRSSGRVLKDKKFFETKMPLMNEPIVSSCLAHWLQGDSWATTGLLKRLTRQINEVGAADGCRSEADVLDRYRRLDLMFRQVQSDGRLRSRSELGGYREMGGILVHIGPKGEFYFGGNGNHRLAIALALGLNDIPAQLGSIHKDALELLPVLRKQQGWMQADAVHPID